MVNLWDKRFPMLERIEKPAVRERRIEEVSTKMNRDAFHSRELALDRPKREAMLERAVARQPEQQEERTRDPRANQGLLRTVALISEQTLAACGVQ